MTVTLPMETAEEITAAAQYTAELVRQGVTFDAVRDYTRHPSGLRSMPALVVTLSR